MHTTPRATSASGLSPPDAPLELTFEEEAMQLVCCRILELDVTYIFCLINF
jgi:hypothetical protein